ncbi:MAG TPA: molybdopterin-dependent oxidoreductase [Candidatus Polarisedimenticolia bacterium]|nr:molybdopterin-dependent oxidoreductase [Candidatus Polarisedimenticolia bacterium]
MPILRSVCPLDCPDACSLEVTVEHDRVVKVDAGAGNPLTGGYICAKVRKFPEHLYSPERILHPAVRAGNKGEGRFRDVSWDEALDLLSGRLAEAKRQFGGESILPVSYGGSNGLLSQDTTDARLFYRLGASRLARTVCSVPTRLAAEGLYGRMPCVAMEDFLHSKLIVMWGFNPSASGIHAVPIIQEAVRRGARLVIVDPRATPLVPLATLHLAPRPGTDLPLALGIIRWLATEGRLDRTFLERHATGLEKLLDKVQPWTPERVEAETGVPAADLETFARLYADSSPAMLRCGWGQERNRNGGSATAAILALPALAGKFGVRGGGYLLSNGKAYGLDPLTAAREAAPPTREINMNRVGETLCDGVQPPVKLLFVYNSNPLATLPAQRKVLAGLLREDLFTVVFDHVLTDTARYADLILPASTFLERYELSRGYGSMVLQEAPAVVSPVGESRSNQEVFGDLCRRLELTRPGEPETDQELRGAILDAHPQGAKYREGLDASRIAHPPTGYAPLPFVDFLPWTDDRKVHLFPESLDRETTGGLYTYRPDPASERYPLALISPASGRTVSSMFGQMWKGPARIDIHPDDAAERGISDQDVVRVFNDAGEVHLAARCTPAVRRGVLVIPKGLWLRHTLNGATSNTLAPDSLADFGGGACFNDARVQVERMV